MPSSERLKQALLINMGLPPGHPTDGELALIIKYILAIQQTRSASGADWKAACQKYVPGAGQYIYASADTSDLNELLRRLLGQ